MNKLILSLALCFAAVGWAPGQSSELIALEAYLGKHPSEVDLLKKPVLSKRLKALMGKKDYQEMVKNWNIDWKLENAGGILHSSGRADQESRALGYHLFVDLKNDNLNVVRFQDQATKTYQEKGEIRLPESLQEAFQKDQSRYMAPHPARPDAEDALTAEGYVRSTADEQTAERIRGFIRSGDVFQDDLNAIPQDERRFSYDPYDLDGDGEMEYLVGFETPYFCGTGGCTYVLFSSGGEVINRFSVSRAPFYVLSSASNGWYELAVDSGGAIRKLVSDGEAYPSNPSTEPVYIGESGEKAHLLLGMDRPVAKFSF